MVSVVTNLLVDLANWVPGTLTVAGPMPADRHDVGAPVDHEFADAADAVDAGGAAGAEVGGGFAAGTEVAAALRMGVEGETFGLTRTRPAAPRDPAALRTAGDAVVGDVRVVAAAADEKRGIPRHDMISSADCEGKPGSFAVAAAAAAEDVVETEVVLLEWVLWIDGW